MTPELFNFHQVITELQVAEDNMLDNHKQTTEQLLQIGEQAEQLLRTTDEVTYDQEGKFNTICKRSLILVFYLF